ncbi:DNA-binding transcriptional regulator, GntR family [Sphingobium faniae]|nr:DNA-binding transcriptional regulator, GntR family [Sphingobium faniae]
MPLRSEETEPEAVQGMKSRDKHFLAAADHGAKQATKRPAAANLAAMVAGRIDAMLGSGELAPGQRLMESEISRMLGVGRMPVREALRILAGDGVVEIIPNLGARIRTMNAQQVADMFKVLMGMMFVALEAFPFVEDREGAVKRLEERRDEIIRNVREQDDVGTVCAAMQYQLELIKISNNEFLMASFKHIHSQFYARQVVKYLPHSRIKKIGQAYDKITSCLAQMKLQPVRNHWRKNLRENAAFLERKSE